MITDQDIYYQTCLWDPVDCAAIDLAGTKVAITGCLALPRWQAIELLQRIGGIYTSSVSRNTDYLVTGNLRGKVSRKLLAARKLQSEERKIALMAPYEFYLSLGLIGDGG